MSDVILCHSREKTPFIIGKLADGVSLGLLQKMMRNGRVAILTPEEYRAKPDPVDPAIPSVPAALAPPSVDYVVEEESSVEVETEAPVARPRRSRR
jgi:hypothetical protein